MIPKVRYFLTNPSRPISTEYESALSMSALPVIVSLLIYQYGASHFLALYMRPYTRAQFHRTVRLKT